MKPQVTLALVGRPNAGKSSLFNALTHGHARVGNFPGITVEALTGSTEFDDGTPLSVVDLPGVYSLDGDIDPESDEGHARRSLDALKGQPHLVAQVLDATQLIPSLRLTKELLARGQPLVILATQHDLLIAQGSELDTRALSDALGVPVLAVSAREKGLRERLLHFIADGVHTAQVPAGRELDEVKLAAQVQRPRSDAVEAARRVRRRTERIDAVVLHPVFGPVVFFSLMMALFASVFLVAEPATTFIDALNRAIGAKLEGLLGPGLVTSLLVDGVLGGAGTVLAFLPQIVVLTVAMELIEASGYLARCTYLVDHALRIAGLGGRSFVPLLTAHACAVPAIQSARIIREPGQRLRTILVLPLMTCSARIPTYGLLITTFFAARSPWFKSAAFVALYVAGVGSAFVASLILGRTVKRAAKSRPLVLELPAYRRPQVRVIARLAARTARRFVRDVGSVILVASVVLWALLTVPGPGSEAARAMAPPGASERVLAMHGSVAAAVGRALEPITRPAGFDWRINVGLIGSMGARELMVGTLGVIFGIEDDDAQAPLAEKLKDAKSATGAHSYGVPTALSLMAFFVIACQCMSTLAAVRRETRSWKWAAFVFGYTYAAAWVLAVVVYQVASLLA
jgi:ferrous iron transport protein B